MRLYYSKQNKIKFQSGFTLVEMIIAVALFSVVMVMGMGALLSVLNANKQTQAVQTVVNNLNLAMEMMSREIRTGSNYHCGVTGAIEDPRDCIGGEDYIAFEPYGGDPDSSVDQVVFWFEEGRLKKSTDGGDTFFPLTSGELSLSEDSYFVVKGSASGDDLQPKVLIVVKGEVNSTSHAKSTFNLQTTVSQRVLDF